MNEPMNKSIKGCRTFDEVLDTEYGKSGTPERNAFECEAEAFILAERLKAERRTDARRACRTYWHEEELYLAFGKRKGRYTAFYSLQNLSRAWEESECHYFIKSNLYQLNRLPHPRVKQPIIY